VCFHVALSPLRSGLVLALRKCYLHMFSRFVARWDFLKFVQVQVETIDIKPDLTSNEVYLTFHVVLLINI
jgi:hypothetical protein